MIQSSTSVVTAMMALEMPTRFSHALSTGADAAALAAAGLGGAVGIVLASPRWARFPAFPLWPVEARAIQICFNEWPPKG